MAGLDFRWIRYGKPGRSAAHGNWGQGVGRYLGMVWYLNRVSKRALSAKEAALKSAALRSISRCNAKSFDFKLDSFISWMSYLIPRGGVSKQPKLAGPALPSSGSRVP